jgi:hypothetical protein
MGWVAPHFWNIVFIGAHVCISFCHRCNFAIMLRACASLLKKTRANPYAYVLASNKKIRGWNNPFIRTTNFLWIRTTMTGNNMVTTTVSVFCRYLIFFSNTCNREEEVSRETPSCLHAPRKYLGSSGVCRVAQTFN